MVVCLLSGLLSVNALAATELKEPHSTNTLTLAEAVQRTLAQNPQLELFTYKNLAIQGREQTAALRPALELQAELENLPLDSGNGMNDTELTVALSSVIELGGKRLSRLKMLGSVRADLEVQQQTAALDLLGEVTRRYVAVLANNERILLAADSQQLAEDTLSAVNKRIDAGGAPESERLRAQAAVVRARLLLSAAERQLQVSKLALAAMWRDTTANFRVHSAALFLSGPTGNFEELYQRAMHNPAITRFASAARLRESELRLAQTNSRADLRWTLGLRNSRETDDTSLVAGFSLPLGSARRNTGAITEAMAARDLVDVQRQVALLDLHTQLSRAFYGRAQAQAEVQLLQKNVVPTLSRAFRQIEIAYRNGRYSYLEWIAAREELLSARSALIETAAAALRYGAEIEQLTSEPLLPATAGIEK